VKEKPAEKGPAGRIGSQFAGKGLEAGIGQGARRFEPTLDALFGTAGVMNAG
jgi:hypothetical protein